MKNQPNVTAIDEIEIAEESSSTNLPHHTTNQYTIHHTSTNSSSSVLPSVPATVAPTTINDEGFWDQENREIQSNISYDKLNTENYNQTNRHAITSLDTKVLILAVLRPLFG